VEEVQSEEKKSWILPSVIKSQQQVTEILYMCPCSCLQGKLPDNHCHYYLLSGHVELFVHDKTVPSHILGVFLSVIYLWVDKVGPVHVMEACGGVGVQFHTFLTLALDDLHNLATLLSGKETPVLVDQEAGWSPIPVWMHLKYEKSFAPAGNESQFLKPTMLSHLGWYFVLFQASTIV